MILRLGGVHASPAYAELAAVQNSVARQTLAEVLAIQAKEPGALRAKTGADAIPIDDLVHRYRDDGLLSDERIKLVKLLAYRYAQTTEPEEAVRRAVSDITGDIVLTSGSEERSEADDIADAWRAVGAQLRHGRPPGEGTSIFDYIVDIEKGAIGGVRQGVQNAIDLLIDTGNELNQFVLDHTGVDFTIARDLPAIQLPEAPDPQTPGGDAAKWLSQFFVGFGPIVKALRFARGGAATTKLGTFAEMEAAAAGASAIALDPLEKVWPISGTTMVCRRTS